MLPANRQSGNLAKVPNPYPACFAWSLGFLRRRRDLDAKHQNNEYPNDERNADNSAIGVSSSHIL
jgi:hypothetical protein